MTPDDVRLTAQLVVTKRVNGVSDASVEALAKRVLELEAAAEEHAANVRHVEREACERVALRYVDEFGSHAGYIAAAIRARGAQASIGRGDPVVWEPVPDDVVLAVCVHYRDELVKAFERAPDAATWRECIDSVRMLNKPVRPTGGK